MLKKAVNKHRESCNLEEPQNFTDALLKASSELTETERIELQLGDEDIVQRLNNTILGCRDRTSLSYGALGFALYDDLS